MPTKNEKDRRRREKRSSGMTTTTGTGSTRHLRKRTDSTDPTQTSAYHRWRRYLPWPATTKGMSEKNCSTTVVEAFRRPYIPCLLKPQRTKFMTYCCKIILISKLYLSIYLLFNLSNKDMKNHYRHTMQDTSPSMSWHMKALPLKVMGPRIAASIMPTLYMGNLVMSWKGGSTKNYPKTCRRHSRGPWTLNPGSLQSSTYIPGKSMRSATLMSAVTIKRLRSMRLNMSNTLTIKVRIMILIIKRTEVTAIAIQTDLTTTRTAPTTATTPPTETSGTTTSMTEIPSNVEVTLKGPVNQDQLAKIKEILKNPRIYKDKLPKNQYPMSGQYAKSFNKFHPKIVEVNEVIIDDVICYGMHLKKSEPEIAETINIYKAFSNDTYYSPEQQATDPPQQEDQ